MKLRRSPWLVWPLYTVLLYVSVASMDYRFSHPSMTETQLFTHLVDAGLWRS